jgi:hypothetical protein
LSIGPFLALNGRRLKAAKADAANTMLARAAGTLDERGLNALIEANIEPATSSSLLSAGHGIGRRIESWRNQR